MSDEQRLTLTIIGQGLDVTEPFAGQERVEEVIKRVLPAGEKQNWATFELRKEGALQALDPAKSLVQDGVANGDVLSLSKKDGPFGGR